MAEPNKQSEAPNSSLSVIDPGLRSEIFISHIGSVPTLPANAQDSFLVDVYRCCKRWLETHSPEGVTARAFILSERPDVDPHLDQFNHFGRLDGESPTSLPGPLILTTRNLRLVFSRACDETTANGLVQAIRHLGLGGRPIALFIPTERMLSFYPSGIEEKPSTVTDLAGIAQLDPSDVNGLIEYFHEHWTRYPDGLGTCWDNATLRIVERNAERNIRNHLFVFLSMVVYRTAYVAREYQLTNGRSDIFIFGVVFDKPDAHCILELKVLRSRSSGWKAEGGKARSYSEAGNKRYVERGLRQVGRYRDATKAARAFLCCFDARLADVDIDIHDYAKSLAVEYSRHYMESTATEQA